MTLAEIGMKAFPKPPKKAAGVPVAKRSKYRAIRTVINGWTFDSKAEGARYLALLALGESGYLRNLELQPFWRLWVGRTAVDPGVCVGKYIADFRYEQRVLGQQGERWEDTIEDVKGMATPVYRLKRKFVEAQYGIQIREIR